jgi:hypothetical protein
MSWEEKQSMRERIPPGKTFYILLKHRNSVEEK